MEPARVLCILMSYIIIQCTVDQSHYGRVYSGSVESNGATGEALESLFMKFNLELPANYRSCSMSVSEVVVLHENGNDQAYFCDSIGFLEVPQFFQPG